MGEFVKRLLVGGVLLTVPGRVGPVIHAAEPDIKNEVQSIAAKGHAEAIFCVAFSPDGSRLASGGDSGAIVIWDAASWRELRQLKGDPAGRTGHFEDVWGVAFSPDGKRLASASHDETVRIWDVDTGEQLVILRGHTFHVWGVDFSSDGKHLASAGGVSDASGQFVAGEIRIWEIATGRTLATMKTPRSRVYSVAFSPDGKSLASGCEDQIIRVWSIATGQELLTLKGHAGEVHVVAWRRDGKLLASGGDDRTVRLWDTTSGALIHTLEGFHGVAFSADGKVLATGGGNGVRLRDAASFKETQQLDSELRFTKMALSPSGKVVAWDSEVGAIQVWTPSQ